jgi:hypothetical protein
MPKNPPLPNAPTNNVGNFSPHSPINKGDIITADAGWWVCGRTHVTGPVFRLRPGESNDTFHWSVGPS